MLNNFIIKVIDIKYCIIIILIYKYYLFRKNK